MTHAPERFRGVGVASGELIAIDVKIRFWHRVSTDGATDERIRRALSVYPLSIR